ncbi:MAG: 3-ketoacyl-ACP reductase [Spirochaetales bacterium]|nr:3-ketoacyl-ACP reductase [Spirochaetales bacterium]
MKRTAVVTGASRGIGLAIARQLGLDGMNVVMVATGSEDKNRDAVEELQKDGITVGYIQADISRHDDRIRIVSEAVRLFGRIDVLVNNAGVAPLQRADLLDMTEESFDRVVGINTKGNMFLTQAVAKQMITQEPLDGRKGVIINISSCSSVVSSVNRGEYCVSKAGISMLTTLYADRLASEGILVHEVRPGVIDTDMTSTVHGKYDKLIEEGMFPIARWGKPQDVANAVSALASDKFMYTTGNYIDVDGGFHIRRL